ncbi:MAG: PIN/TRAM domain-containing protein [Xenococcus sp. MO_188.B8]|nr:PIN/TRAM domain-containing protein [Xenococcus sp. MO_188.B8]
MIDAIIIIICIVAAINIGFDSLQLLPEDILMQVSNISALRFTIAGFSAIIGLGVGVAVQTTYRRLESQVRKTPIEVIITRAIGLAIGLLIANLMLAPMFLLPIPEELSFIKPAIAIMGSVMFSYMGISLADTHGRTFLRLINPGSLESILVAEGTLEAISSKILDTSCIIDGRIESLLKTGFLEGNIIIPKFVLQELQNLADNSNDQKRIRGRRGLDILNRIQEDFPERIIIRDTNYENLDTVDAKLVMLTQEISGILLTNDYNLSKVASLQGVSVLNINDLAQSLRPLYLPGDNLELKIIKQGKEPEQGIGYLDDGTMVVVDEGHRYVGGEIQVIVTSSLQTSAGRMIFAKPGNEIIVNNN